MGRNPFPSFNWYPGDWLSSRARALMTLEQQGAYLNLLSQAWLGDPPCSLPIDVADLARLSGLGDRWAECSPEIVERFIERRGRLVNEKLLKIYREAARMRRQKQEAGKKGNDKRWNKQGNEASHRDRTATVSRSHLATGLRSPSTSTSTSTPEKEEEKNAPSAPQTTAIAGSIEDLIWNSGLAYLTSHGVSQSRARPLLGRLRKDHGDKALAAAIGRMLIERPSDPAGWLVKAAEPRDIKPSTNAVRMLRLSSGRVIEVKPGVRVEYTDVPGAIDGLELPNGKLSVRSGARWVKGSG